MANTNKWGIVAEFESPAAIYTAAEKTTAHGYTRVDAHTPFPVHGLDKALRQGPSPLGWVVLCCGIAGIGLAQLMMWWMNAEDYVIWVSGKEPYAWPSTIPITFELMVLLSGFGAVFGMFGINKLPRLHHPEGRVGVRAQPLLEFGQRVEGVLERALPRFLEIGRAHV